MVILFMLWAVPAFAQLVDTAWVRRYDGTGNSGDHAYDIAVDSAGNVYVTGNSVGNVTGADCVTIKYDPNGNQLWVKRYNDPYNKDDGGTALAVDGSGNVCVTGFSGALGENWCDFLTIKYDSNGNQLWVRTYNGTGNSGDRSNAIVVDDSGNVYVTGYSAGTGDTTHLPGDYATIKYDKNGNQLWVRRYNGPDGQEDEATDIALDDSGNVYVTGVRDMSEPGYCGDGDYATIKYDTSGNEIWVGIYNGPGYDQDIATDLVIDGSGNVYVTGGSCNDDTTVDYATIKYDRNGNQLWVRRYRGPGFCSVALAITVDNSGNVYVTGESGGLGGGAYGDDYATIKYDSNGTQLWAKRYNGPGNYDDVAYAIAVDVNGNVYVTGGTTVIYFGDNYGDYTTIKYDADGDEVWVMNYNGLGDSTDMANALAVDGSGNVYVTGGSTGNGTNLDYATIKYMQKVRFRSNPDGWRFPNEEDTMWPQEWWRRFDYSQGWPKYPPGCGKWAYSSDFPDWELFVDAFGIGQCYWLKMGPLAIFRAKAIEMWRALKEPWEGSCFGFAISSLLYYNGHLSLSETFPTCSTVYSVPINSESRKLVNKYWIYQFGKEHQAHIHANWKTTSTETLNNLQQMLLNEKRNNAILILVSQDFFNPGAHAVVACSLAQDSGDPNTYHIYIYDNNIPGTDQILDINTLNGTWYYSNLPNWGGNRGIFLMDTINTYIPHPTLPKELPPKERYISTHRNLSEFIEIFNAISPNIVIRNPGGEAIGYSNSALIDSMANASPIIPITGSEHPPVGYFLPNDTYTVQISNSPDTTSYFSVFADSTVFAYYRNDCQLTQTDNLKYFPNGKQFQVKTDDPMPKDINLKAIVVQPDREKVCDIQNLVFAQNDSFQLETVDKIQFKLTNTGTSKTYNLNLELASANLNPMFAHDSISLSEFSSHLITPNWAELDTQAVTIFIDNNLDGVFDETLFVENQYLIRGDVNRDRKVTVSDVIYLINYLFRSGSAPYPIQSGDVNCDGRITVSDVVYLINYLFKGGPPPCK